MFDSPIADWTPGEIKVIGWPWHGRVDIKTISGKLTPVLTLPTGRAANLNFTPTVITSRRPQTGTLFLFSAPDAQAVERSDDEKSRDKELGAEWRTSYLFCPKEQVVYGNVPNFLSTTSWPWRKDGKTYWVRISGISNASLYKPILITRNTENNTENEPQRVALSFPDGRPESLVDENNTLIGTWSVMDVARDGSKAVMARFSRLTRAASMSSSAEGDWNESPVEYWEITPQLTDGTFSATMKPLRSRSEVAGSVTSSQASSSVRNVSLAGNVVRVGNGSESDKGVYQITWETKEGDGEGMAESRQYINGDFSYEFKNRIIALYYSDSGELVEIKANGGYVTTYTTSLSGGGGGSATFEAVDAGDGTYSSGYALTPIADGSLTFTYSFSQSVKIVARYEVVNGGAVAPGVVFEAETTWSVSGSSPYTLSTDRATTTESKDSGQGGIKAVLKVGGKEVWSDSCNGSASTTTPGPFSHTALPNTPQLGGGVEASYSPPTTNVKMTNSAASRETNISITGVRYAACVPAAAAHLREKTGDVLKERLHIGGGAFPAPSAVFSDGYSYDSVNEIYGSYNPATGEFLRDTSNPVFWI